MLKGCRGRTSQGSRRRLGSAAVSSASPTHPDAVPGHQRVVLLQQVSEIVTSLWIEKVRKVAGPRPDLRAGAAAARVRSAGVGRAGQAWQHGGMAAAVANSTAQDAFLFRSRQS